MKLARYASSISALIFFILSIPCAFPAAAATERETFIWNKVIVPGIKYSHIKEMSPLGPLHIHILRVDLKNEKIKVKPQLANGVIGALEKTSDIAMRNNSIAAINGSFFEARKKLHLPVGFMIIDGHVVNKSILERTTIGIKKDKEIVFGIPKTKGYVVDLDNKKSVEIWGVNRPRKKNEVVIYTGEYGETTGTNRSGLEIAVGADGNIIEMTNGDSKIPRDGFVVSLHGWTRDFAAKLRLTDRIGLVYDLADDWKDVQQAITGGPLLVKEGNTVHKESIASEKFNGKLLEPNSRTAIGLSKDNELLMVVVDRQERLSTGVTYDELARIIKEAGAEYAMGMDGGHASTMYLDGRVVNYPMQGYEAPVSNAMLVFYDGWKLANVPKSAPVPRVYVASYRPPSDDLVEALKNGADLSPSTYVPRPEDFGTYAIYDIYRRVLKPMVPDSLDLDPGFFL